MSDDIKKGLLGIVVDETTISQVMPDINSLTYRGYAVQDLCEKCSFEEVAYLILNKELPDKTKLKKFKKELEENRNITINLREIVKHMPKKAHPMDVARTVISVMGLEDTHVLIFFIISSFEIISLLSKCPHLFSSIWSSI